MKKEIILSWVLQIICAGIMFAAGYSKMSSNPASIEIFSALGMEPTGRWIIGVIEISCGFALLTKRLSALGAFITFGVMLGAFIAHASVLGFIIQNDGGKHMIMLGTVILSSCGVMYFRRKHLPFY